MAKEIESEDKGIMRLHSLYNEIGTIQRQLPAKPGRNDYSGIEQIIKDKAYLLILECNEYLKNGNCKFADQADNLVSGAQQIMKNPYLRIG